MPDEKKNGDKKNGGNGNETKAPKPTRKLTKRMREDRILKVIANLQECMTGMGQEKRTRIEEAVRKQVDIILKPLSRG